MARPEGNMKGFGVFHKVRICDLCVNKEGTLTMAKGYMKVKGKNHMRLDYCKDCEKIIPTRVDDFTKFAGEILAEQIFKSM